MATTLVNPRRAVRRATAASISGCTSSTSYQYFPDKDALLAEIRRRCDEAFRDRLLSVVGRVADLPLREAVAECVATLVALHVEDAGLHNAVSGGVSDAERRLLEQIVASFLGHGGARSAVRTWRSRRP